MPPTLREASEGAGTRDDGGRTTRDEGRGRGTRKNEDGQRTTTTRDEGRGTRKNEDGRGWDGMAQIVAFRVRKIGKNRGKSVKIDPNRWSPPLKHPTLNTQHADQGRRIP